MVLVLLGSTAMPVTLPAVFWLPAVRPLRIGAGPMGFHCACALKSEKVLTVPDPLTIVAVMGGWLDVLRFPPKMIVQVPDWTSFTVTEPATPPTVGSAFRAFWIVVVSEPDPV